MTPEFNNAVDKLKETASKEIRPDDQESFNAFIVVCVEMASIFERGVIALEKIAAATQDSDPDRV